MAYTIAMQKSTFNTTPTTPITPEQRFDKIYRLLKSRPAASNPREASDMIERAMHDIEGPLFKAKAIKAPMVAFSHRQLKRFPDKEREIYYHNYPSHVVFIAKNGAINIRWADKKNKKHLERYNKKPVFYIEDLRSDCEKPGFDGKGVWE